MYPAKLINKFLNNESKVRSSKEKLIKWFKLINSLQISLFNAILKSVFNKMSINPNSLLNN